MITLVGFNFCMNALMDFQFVRSSKPLGAESASIRPDAGVSSVVNLQLVRSSESLLASGAFERFYIQM